MTSSPLCFRMQNQSPFLQRLFGHNSNMFSWLSEHALQTQLTQSTGVYVCSYWLNIVTHLPQTLCYLVCYCSMFTIVAIVSCSVAVTRLRDVPYFGPALPEHARFKKNQEFKELLLTKCKHYLKDTSVLVLQCAQHCWLGWMASLPWLQLPAILLAYFVVTSCSGKCRKCWASMWEIHANGH